MAGFKNKQQKNIPSATITMVYVGYTAVWDLLQNGN